MDKLWGVLFGVVLAAAGLLFVVAPIVGWWLPKDVSSYGHEVDFLFYLILGFTGFFFLLTSGILVYSMYRYVGQPGKKAWFVHGNHRLEMFWTAVPAAILLIIAFTQISAWSRIKYKTRMPDPNQIIDVTARQFEWRVRYPNGRDMQVWLSSWDKQVPGREPKMTGRQLAEEWVRTPSIDDIHVVNEVHVWKGTQDDKGEWKGANVRVYLKTRDVLHSFFLPQMRLKQDAVPGKTIPVWFQATDYNTKYNKDAGRWQDGYDPATGQFGDSGPRVWELACAELCGRDHTKMWGRLYVHETKEDFLEWLKDTDTKQNYRGTPAKD